MHRLFWRYFLLLWLVIASLVAASIVLTTTVASQRFQSLRTMSPEDLTEQARQVAQTEHLDGLRAWATELENRHLALSVYIIEDVRSGRDILGRPIPPRTLDLLLKNTEQPAWNPASGQVATSHPDGAPSSSWWGARRIELADGHPLLLKFLPFDNSRWEMLGLSFIPYTLLGLALAITLSLSWLMARHVTRPIRALTRTADALADDPLMTPVDETLTQRRDAIGQLARSFSTMADRIQGQVGARAQLLRNVAHELRSPLARLQVAVELAMDSAEAPTPALKLVAREGQRLDHLIQHPLDRARLGDLPRPRDPVDLSELCGLAAEDARFEGVKRPGGLSWTVPDQAVVVLGDRNSLHSAIENLLRNALRHSDPAQPIELRLHCQGRMAVIEVRDGGPGVEEAELERIFDPFHRSGNGRQRDGSGLGLSIVQACVRAHQGRIQAINLPSPAPGFLMRMEIPLA